MKCRRWRQNLFIYSYVCLKQMTQLVTSQRGRAGFRRIKNREVRRLLTKCMESGKSQLCSSKEGIMVREG